MRDLIDDIHADDIGPSAAPFLAPREEACPLGRSGMGSGSGDPEGSGTTYLVIPTLNEAANLRTVIEGVRRAMADRPYRVLIVDDSTDYTTQVALALSKEEHPIDDLQRKGESGIGSAIRDGFEWCMVLPEVGRVVTMDADLSHDPADLPALLEALRGADLVQGSRFVRGGRSSGTRPRRLMSLIANAIASVLLATGMKEHTTYFRAYSPRAVKAAVKSQGFDGYEWALGSLLAIQGESLIVREVPITFRERHEGDSKLTIAAMVRWLRSLLSLAFARREAVALSRVTRFATVGAAGIAVNQGALFILLLAGVSPLPAIVVAIQASILFNFLMNDRWTFRDRGRASGRGIRLARYQLVCAVGFVVNVTVFALLALVAGMGYYVSNLFAILAGFAANFRGSIAWTWVGK